jgi:hypothetical protein
MFVDPNETQIPPSPPPTAQSLVEVVINLLITVVVLIRGTALAGDKTMRRIVCSLTMHFQQPQQQLGPVHDEIVACGGSGYV